MREEVDNHPEGFVKVQYYEIRMPDGRFWRFEFLQDAEKFAAENNLGHINFHI